MFVLFHYVVLGLFADLKWIDDRVCNLSDLEIKEIEML